MRELPSRRVGALVALLLGACEVFAFAPASDWRLPSVWLSVLLLWCGPLALYLAASVVWRLAVGRRTGLRRFGDMPLALVVGAVAGMHLSAAMHDAGGKVLWIGLATLVAALVEWVNGRRIVPRTAAALRLSALAAPALLVHATKRAAGGLDENLGSLLLALAVLGVAIAISYRKWGPRSLVTVAALAVAAIGVFRFATQNPHDVYDLTPVRGAASQPLPDVYLVILDTCRADALAGEGAAEAMPRVTAFTDSADHFRRAIANASWTLPGHASLFTGTRLIEHRTDVTPMPGFRPTLDPDLPTLQEQLARVGYRSVCLAANPLVGPQTGLAREFHRYGQPGRRWMEAIAPIRWFNSLPTAKPYPWMVFQTLSDLTGLAQHATADEIVGLAEREIARIDGPRYVVLNLMDFHLPYQRRPSVELSARLSFLRDQLLLYAGIADAAVISKRQAATMRSYYYAHRGSVDAALGRLFDALAARGALDSSIVVLTADHGEALWDDPEQKNYFGHQAALEPAVRIPLVVKRPGQREGRVFDHYVQQSDLAPTLLELIGLPSTGGGTPVDEPERGPIATEWYPRLRGHGGLLKEPRVGLYEDDFKFVRQGTDEKLFDLAASPWENVEVAASESERAERMATTVEELFVAPLAESATSGEALDPELEARLRALGYVQ